MNENIDLTKILKDCPIGWKFYSSIYGDLLYSRMYLSSSAPKITFIKPDSISSVDYYQDGKRYLSQGECTLFPSKDQRDWSKFEAPWYKKKIEPKFHVGQYITDGYIGGQIISMEDNYTCYKILDFNGGTNITIPITLQNNCHLWTIQDAKDGDVLAFSNDTIVIFKDLYNSTSFHSYCHIENGIFDFNKDELPDWWNSEDFKPATKEQSDLLFQKIQDAGYKWNAETKILEKLVKPKFKVGDRIRHKESNKDDVYVISKVYNDAYGIVGLPWMLYMKYQDRYEFVPNKFDVTTLKPFDKVLVRDSSDRRWRCALFSHVRKEDENYTFKYVTTACTYEFCIPYNDDTKHLVGTNEDAPEFYRYWED